MIIVPKCHISNKPQTFSYAVKLFLMKLCPVFFMNPPFFFLQFVIKLQFAGIIITIFMVEPVSS